MRILINDHAGHPFQVQLSRELASRGHEVLHTYTENLTTPRGALERDASCPGRFNVKPIVLLSPFERYGLVRRSLQELELGRCLVNVLREFQPDLVLSANTPLGAQRQLIRECRSKRIDFVFWLQDLLGIGIRTALRNKLPLLGNLIGNYYLRLEEKLLRESSSVVVITDDFVPPCRTAGVCAHALHVIPNWAPLADIPLTPKNNAWSAEQNLVNTFNFIYSGTLGMKHNPELLVKLAIHVRPVENVRLIVITEGLGADYLREQKSRQSLDQLVILPFQPFDRMAEILGSADVLIALLESSAGAFAVPSKVLTYLCAGRALLLSVPPENLAARIVSEQHAGIVVTPTDDHGFTGAAQHLVKDAALRERMSTNGRAYAERTFDIDGICDRFEAVFAPSRPRLSK